MIDQDRYHDATAMCRAYNRPDDFLQAMVPAVPLSELLIETNGRTWLYPSLAFDLAQRCSPALHVAVCSLMVEGFYGIGTCGGAYHETVLREDVDRELEIVRLRTEAASLDLGPATPPAFIQRMRTGRHTDTLTRGGGHDGFMRDFMRSVQPRS